MSRFWPTFWAVVPVTIQFSEPLQFCSSQPHSAGISGLSLSLCWCCLKGKVVPRATSCCKTTFCHGKWEGSKPAGLCFLIPLSEGWRDAGWADAALPGSAHPASPRCGVGRSAQQGFEGQWAPTVPLAKWAVRVPLRQTFAQFSLSLSTV